MPRKFGGEFRDFVVHGRAASRACLLASALSVDTGRVDDTRVQLPKFQYHPDPVASGSVVRSDAACACCGRSRGWSYAGPVYGEEEPDGVICPWCIADGSAHARLGVSFVDEAGVGGAGEREPVPDRVVAAVAYRTPGFSAWQQEQWWTHCGDAAQFLGPAGSAELARHGHEAIAAIRAATGPVTDEEWLRLLASLSTDRSPTAYVFRCSRCGALGGYWDCD